jgi:NADPH-dependent 2,4-dienoyl-CoA reductase/sulfur reductase-like enzyme
MALGLRFISAELAFGGLSLDEGIEMARRIEEHGKVDFLDAEGVLTYHAAPLTVTMYNPSHFNLDYITPIKEAVAKLAILGNVIRLVDPRKAEEFIASGKMDMVGGARLFITDPEWVNKAQSGRVEEILSCIACNQYCFERLNMGLPVGCVINPAAGREKEWGHGTLVKAQKKKKVLVIGGGPAGLEVARVAALRGHDVVVYEKERELGGQLRLAARLPGRGVMATTIRWYEAELTKAGVQIVTGKEASRETLAAENPEVVVLATGARYVRTGLSGFVATAVEGWEDNNVVTPEEVISGKARIGKGVVIYDDEGFVTALGLAEMLLEQGKEVEIVTRYPFVGSNLIFNFQLYPLQARVAGKVKLTPNAFVKSFIGKRVVVCHLHTMEEEGIEPVDSLIMTTSKESCNALLNEWKSTMEEVYAVGDCVSPRGLGEAVYDGHRVGRVI